MKRKNPIRTSPGMNRRKFLKALTFGGLVVAAGPLALNPVWAWLKTRSDQAFTAKASGQVAFPKRPFGKRMSMMGKRKLGKKSQHPHLMAKNTSGKKKVSV